MDLRAFILGTKKKTPLPPEGSLTGEYRTIATNILVAVGDFKVTTDVGDGYAIQVQWGVGLPSSDVVTTLLKDDVRIGEATFVLNSGEHEVANVRVWPEFTEMAEHEIRAKIAFAIQEARSIRVEERAAKDAEREAKEDERNREIYEANKHIGF